LNKKIVLTLTIVSLIFLCIGCASANDLNDTVGSDFDDLSSQINHTGENQILNLEKDYELKDSSQKHIVIEKPMTIDGNNHTIQAPDLSRVFWVKSDDVTIKNINFINSNTANLAGGVISWWGANGTLTNCNFTNNSAVSAGGAVLWKGDNGTITRCNFEDNRVNYGKAVSLVDGEGFDPSLIHIQIVNSEGGALFVSGNNVIIDYCNFYDNLAALNGGAISINWGQNVTVSNSKFKRNSAGYNGGAIDWNSNSATLINSAFEENSPKNLFLNAEATIINSTFDRKSSIDSWYNVTYVNVTFMDIGTFEELSNEINNTPEGGLLVLDKDYEYINGSNKGILINKTITIDGSGHTLNGNHSSRMFNITAGNVTIRNINFVNGNALGKYFAIDIGGGAIYWSGDNGFIENCSFTNNTGWGIEDDPFDREEKYTDENGTVWYVVRYRPMGAKVNEGGAIVWNGTNGTVSNCIFVRNAVGYPNTGGAICWRGDNGTIIGSEFYENDAWCGSAIAWIGNNGTILFSTIANSTFFDGGIYWFGNNGTVKNSILLGNGFRSGLGPYEANVKADYNFWGDTLDNPHQEYKIANVTKWLVMKFTHNGELVKKGQKVVIRYDITNLYAENGNMTQYDALIDKSGQMVFTAPKAGYLNITLINGNIHVDVDSKDKIKSKDKTSYYKAKTIYKVKVTDLSGKVVGKYVKFTIGGKNHKVKTNKNGVATLKIKLKPGKYVVTSSYGSAKVKNKITVKNTLITKNVKVKVKKSAKFTVKVLNSKGKAFAKKLVKVKFKGKTYKLKTNKNGKATFKIPKNLKAGKYTIRTSCNGLTNVNKIIVKK
jgi:hypothetical protein